MLTWPAGALRRKAAVPVSRDARPAAADLVPANVHPDRALLLLGLASRTAYLIYATAVVLLGLGGYQRPALAGAALAVAVLASASLGLRVRREQAFSGLVAVLDSGTALVVLILVAAALRQPGQYGALNWALTYAVACAVWLGLDGRLSWRVWPACALGLADGVTALRGGAVDPARTIAAAVNAASVPMYFVIAAAVSWVVRRIAAQIAARQAVERAQRRDLAALAERERLVGQVHRSVLATLEEIAAGQVPWAELCGRAGAQVSMLRQAFGEPPGPGARDGLRALLATLARDRAGDGWRIGLIDDELTGEPAPAAALALRDALAELVSGPAPAGRPPVRTQVRAAGHATELLVRIPGDARAMAGPIARAGARLAADAGTAVPMPARPDEVRVLLRVPS